MTRKIAELANIISSIKPDIILGTETWLDQNIHSRELFPYGFNIFRRDRNRNGGGVLIAISDQLTCHEVPELSAEGCEMIWAKVHLKGRKHLLVSSYYNPRTRDADSLKAFQTISQRATATNSLVVIGGDFNLPAIDWSTQTLKTNTNHPGLHLQFLDLVHDLGLEQMVTGPTRVDNTLDLFLTNNPSLVPRVEILHGLSDHDAVYLELETHMPRHNQAKILVPLYKKADWLAMTNAATKLSDKIASMHNETTEDLWKEIKESLIDMVDQNIPTKTLGTGSKHHKPWIDFKTLKLIRRRDHLYKWLKKAGKSERNQNKKKDNSHTEIKNKMENERAECIERKKTEWKNLKRDVQRRLRRAYFVHGAPYRYCVSRHISGPEADRLHSPAFV